MTDTPGTHDHEGRWQPGFHDHTGRWHGGYYDAEGRWQPGYYDINGQWQPGFFDNDGTFQRGYHDAQGVWQPGFFGPDGNWVSADATENTYQPLDQHQSVYPQAAQQDAPPDHHPTKKGKGGLIAALAGVLAFLLLAGGGLWFFWDSFFEDDEEQPAVQTEEPDPTGEPAAGNNNDAQTPTPEPDVPTVAAGYFDADPDTGAIDVVDPHTPGGDEEVITTNGSFTVDSIGYVDSIEVDGEDAQAPDGEILHLVEWSFTPGEQTQEPPAGSASAIIGGQRHGLTALEYSETSGTFLASVGDDDVVEIGAHGITQRFSLADGIRIQEAPAAGFYRDTWALEPADLMDTTTVSLANGAVSTELLLQEAIVTTYEDYTLEPQGWASEGHIWIVLNFHIQLQGPSQQHEYTSGNWDIELTDTEGDTYRNTYVSQAGGEYGWPNGWFYLAFEVPLDTDEVEVSSALHPTFSPGGTQTITSEGYTLDVPHELSP